MNTEAIDWSKAPDDATHYFTDNGMWYKFTSGSAYVSEGYEKNWNLSGFSGNPPDESFIPLPVSSEQPVSAEVETNVSIETAVSTETHSIEPKPPLGLTPKNLWEEQMQHQRRQDIHAAMQRYIEAGKDIPNDWLEELLELNNILAKIETDLAKSIQSSPVAKGGEWAGWGKKSYPDIPIMLLQRKLTATGTQQPGVIQITYGLDHRGGMENLTL